MEKQPLISVIVPVYKVEAYLDQCIRSICAQTYHNLEIILVEDGSPDRSGAICDAWAEKDSRIRVIHKENGGGGAARNTALDASSGALIAFVDSDDYIAADMLAHLYSLLEQGADIAECGYLKTTENNAVFPEETGTIRFYTPEEAMGGNIRDEAFSQLIWNKLYRREMIGQIRFPVGTKIDDEFFTYRVLGNASRLIRSEKCCYAYRQQENSVMHQSNPRKNLEGLRARHQRVQYLENRMPQLVNEAKIELLMTCIYAMQACQSDMTGEEKARTEQEIRSILDSVGEADLTQAGSTKQTLLIKAFRRWPEAVAVLLNRLIQLHILT